jgi:hypothetical protein
VKKAERVRKAKAAARREAIDGENRKKGKTAHDLEIELLKLNDEALEARYKASLARNRA